MFHFFYRGLLVQGMRLRNGRFCTVASDRFFEQPSVGTGTVLRPAALEAIAREAGFREFTVLPTEHDAFRFYRLDP